MYKHVHVVHGQPRKMPGPLLLTIHEKLEGRAERDSRERSGKVRREISLFGGAPAAAGGPPPSYIHDDGP